MPTPFLWVKMPEPGDPHQGAYFLDGSQTPEGEGWIALYTEEQLRDEIEDRLWQKSMGDDL